MSKITEQIDAAGIKTTNEYDWAGNLTKQTDALGNSSSYTYNSAGQMISAVDKAGNVCYATYDGMGNITSMTDPGGSAKTYSYDTAGRMLERKATGDKSEKCTYNAAGLLSYKHDAKYKHHYYTYDAAGRILSESIDTNPYGKTEIISYTYDANGNVLTVSDTSGTVTREYDALNRVSKYTDKFGNTVEYEYDACGNLSEMKYPNGDVGIYTYDANHNMLKSSLGEDILETVYEYNVRNQITKVTMPDGSWESRSYDSAGRLQIKNSRTLSGKMLFVYIYTYDSLGRIATELDAITMTEYTMTYDEMGRLTNRHVKDRNGEYDESFIYDPAGNIITSSGWGPDYEYTYGKYNKLSSINEKGLVGIDDAGNTTFYYLDGTAVDLRYDERNRLMDLTHGYGSYGYDAENNRTYADGVKYIYDTSDGRNRVAESIDGEGNVTIYGYGADGLVWSKSGDEYMVYHYDYRGSVVAVTDKDSNITDTLRYDAYGNTINRTGNSKLIFGYNGQYGVQTDKSGYLYMRTRYYSPKFKRFLSADVIDGNIADSTTLNLFTYVNGNPISFVDPFGMSADNRQNGGLSIGFEFNPGPSDYIGWSLDGQEIAVRSYNYVRYGFNVSKVGQYAIIKGAHSSPALSQGIKGTRYALKNADVYTNVFSYIDPITAGKEALKPISHGSVNWGSVLGYGTVALDVGIGVYDNIQDGTRTQKIVTDAIVDTGVGVGTIWASSAAGAAIGSIVPGPGNAIGAAGGFVVGGVIYVVTDVITINDKSLVDWGKEGLGWVGDKVVDIGVGVSDSVGDFCSWIGDTWESIW